MTSSPAAVDLLAAARERTALIRAYADETERDRRLAAPVVRALRSDGLFAMGLPASLGGLETPLPDALRVIEQVAYADGATGWNVMIAFDAGLACGTLHAADARALIASLSRPILASAPGNGRAVRTMAGYRLTGRWRFGSGCQQAEVFIVTGALFDGDEPVRLPNGAPELRQFVLPAADVEIIDTWHTTGLRGTGSHDFAVEDRLVAEGFTQPLDLDVPVEHGPLYAVPEVAVLASAKAAVAFGIAQHALESLKELAQTKAAMGQTSLLRERAAVQIDVARAEALVRAGRAFLYATVDEVWRDIEAGRAATIEQQAILRLAAVDGVQRAVQAVDLLYNAGGATAIYASSPLERCFRDVHVIPAHVVVQPSVYEAAGRVLLGLPSGTAVW